MQNEFSFRILKEIPKFKYSQPLVKEYEDQKQIRIVIEDDETQLNSLLIESDVVSLYKVDPIFERSWQCFFGRRINAASTGTFSKLCSLFPGHTIAGPGRNGRCSSTRYRGSLLFEQFLHQLSLDRVAQHINHCLVQLEPLREKWEWPWYYVDQPTIQFIRAGHSSYAENIDPNIVVGEVIESISRCLNSETLPIEKMFGIVREVWNTSKAFSYDEITIQISQRIIERARLRNRKDIVPLLFELEGFASYRTCSRSLKLFASGVFANNWVEIGCLPVSNLRGTELVVRDRLFDELINLTGKRFAPIVVNEHGSVADGNHRLTAAWIWNLLRSCLNCDWAIEDEEFQQQVAKFVKASGIGPISIHESLRHLASFLTMPGLNAKLTGQIRPVISANDEITEVPVLLVPEYLSGAVVKDPYDQGNAAIRVPPQLYESIANIPTAVLPPRASYHFTDCALLPWFSVLDPAKELTTFNVQQDLSLLQSNSNLHLLPQQR